MRPDTDIIVFDGQCIFCSRFAQFMAGHDHGARFRFVTAQSETGRVLYHAHDLDPDEMSTNIVIVDGVAHTKMQAFAAAMRSLGWPWRAFAILGMLPKLPADWIYDRIARNRYVFGRRHCPIPSSDLKMRLLD